MLQSNLNIDNNLSLTGTVASLPKINQSPSGIKHCQFWLDHNSKQCESGLERQAWCTIMIAINEDGLIKQTQGITVGCKILIRGFITTHKQNNGSNHLVLHAKQIEIID